MGQIRHKTWTEEEAELESKKYSTLRDFMYNSQGCYKASKRNGWLEGFVWLDCSRKKKKELYPYELCYAAAKTCRTLKNFKIKYPRIYKKACNQKWIRDYHWLRRDVSIGEREVEEKLKAYCVRYMKQMTFPWLRHKREMKIDFYLPDYRVGLEIQGMQHFEKDGFYSNDGDMERDTLKFELCKRHGIDIMYYADKASVIDRVKDKKLVEDVYYDSNLLIRDIISEDLEYI